MTRRDRITWPPEEGASDERLAYLAARPTMLKWARPWWMGLFRLGEAAAGSQSVQGHMLGNRYGVLAPSVANPERGEVDDRMSDYAGACEEVSKRLDPVERATLRAAGELPDWFLPAVRKEAKALSKKRRSIGP